LTGNKPTTNKGSRKISDNTGIKCFLFGVFYKVMGSGAGKNGLNCF
jgi:tetrahydromethanopterin S-methyltransferase subunit H